MDRDLLYDYERRVRQYATDLWEQAGRPHGRDLEFWFEAERLVKHRRLPPVVHPYYVREQVA